MAIICPLCEKEFASKASLASHKNRYHPKSHKDIGDKITESDDGSADLSKTSSHSYRKLNQPKHKPLDSIKKSVSNEDGSSEDESHQNDDKSTGSVELSRASSHRSGEHNHPSQRKPLGSRETSESMDSSSGDESHKSDDRFTGSINGDPAELSKAPRDKYRKQNHSKRKPFDSREKSDSTKYESSVEESDQSDEDHVSDESETTVDFGSGRNRDALRSIHPTNKRALYDTLELMKDTLNSKSHINTIMAVAFQERMKEKVPEPFKNYQLSDEEQMYFLHVLYKIPEGHFTELSKFISENISTVLEIIDLIFKVMMNQIHVYVIRSFLS